MKFGDLNGNGVKDTNENGLFGWEIQLNDGAYTTTTDPSGNYCFTGLGPGTYTVTEVLQPGWTQTTPPHPPITLACCQTVTGIDFGNQYTISIPVSIGWNIVSVPLTVDDYRKIILFPTAVSNAFAYVGNYVVKDTLENGFGYWLKFGNAQNIQLTGLPLITDTIDVTTGWNLIGSISQTISAASIQPIGTTIISPLFGYNNGYFITDSIEPGKGYWVKVSSAGKLVLSSTLLVSGKESMSK
ncbi:MAG: SdrD B-like domain-containing protein [Bacteroidota bacterium]|nr:SdrD B-like domain-containing protein [Bacteroidota bacterium]